MSAVTSRSALDALTKVRLLELAARFEIDIAAGRPKAQIVDALARSSRATIDQLLAAVKLDELKKICRAHEIDATARDRKVLVDRILGGEGTAAAEALLEYRAPPEAAPVDVTRKRGRKRGDAEGEAGAEPTSLGWASSTKVRLQRFALAAAAGYRDRDAEARFAEDLIRCFGWGPDDVLPAEMPATVRFVQQGRGSEQRLSALLRQRRAVVQVIERDRAVQDGWTELLPVLLQLTPIPQYVVITNQRDVELYDLARLRAEPRRLGLALDQLPKYSEAFPFLAQDWSPGATPLIINVERVSKEVADLVARVYRSFKAEHPRRVDEVIRFTLQCIIAMFAEDIGLLPKQYFTSLLYVAAEKGDASERLAELFRQMSTPGDGTREIRYFNGGLFREPVTLSVNKVQLAALTKAAEADWTYVDPHIFGAVFQGIMDDDERHATGAHYTAKEDIMRVVGPTIVEPWRKRIAEAKTLAELKGLRKELTQYRVLDPACGSGNFLYVAFRELYRLETEVLARMQEFPSVGENASARAAWGSGIPTTNFFGIDINRFAVELARATLNIAKKIAFDERHQVASERFGQMQLEIDPSLPLDNLETNIVCADALELEWPEVDSIVGNPPFLGGLKIRQEMGVAYLEALQRRFPEVNGRADFCSYWFRRAHERLPHGGRAGLVGTNSVREGPTMAATTQYICQQHGTITNAVSSREWLGEAVVRVSMVNWTKGYVQGPHSLIVEDRLYLVPAIAPHLQLHGDASGVITLKSNEPEFTTAGIQLGTKAFQVPGSAAARIAAEDLGGVLIRPLLSAADLLRGKVARDPDYVLDGNHLQSPPAQDGSAASRLLHGVIKTEVHSLSSTFDGWSDRWWQHWRPRRRFLSAAKDLRRLLTCSRHAARAIFVFVSPSFLPTDSMQVFRFEDDYSFGVLQSGFHWRWIQAKGTKIKDDLRYTAEVWRTFPWPQQVPHAIVKSVCDAARALRTMRRELMAMNDWSLRALYQASAVPGTHPLKDAQAQLDAAVATAYDMSTGQDTFEFLRELNLALAEDEAQGRSVCGPGLPRGFDAKDASWTSDDCIEPTPLDAERRGESRG